MIRYQLRCQKGHKFEGWFASSEGFEAQRDSRRISCTQCGETSVDRALMAPGVPARANRDGGAATGKDTLSSDEKTPLERLREHVEANSDYVGLRFADEARAMHEGREPGRAIHGEARPEEARALLEEGVPIAPLPFIPKRQTN